MGRSLGCLTAAALGHHSTLYVWMWRNHATFADVLALGRPCWRDIAAELGRRGLRDGDGKEPSAERCRLTWRAVAERKKAQKPAKNEPVAREILHKPPETVRNRQAETVQENAPVSAPGRGILGRFWG